MCIEVVQRVVTDDVLLELFEIPDDLRELCKLSWENRDMDCLGRFDFIYDGLSKPKLLEYNADTPTLLVESGIGQKLIISNYLDQNFDLPKEKIKSFNFIENSVIHVWRKLMNRYKFSNYIVTGDTKLQEEHETLKYMHHLMKLAQDEVNKSNHFSSIDSEINDIENIHYMKDKDIILSTKNLKNTNVEVLWKLYPYEWLTEELFGEYFEKANQHLIEDKNNYSKLKVKIIEPYWKLILSSKALIPFLWEMFPNHPNLLPAYFENPQNLNNPQVIKDRKEYNKWVIKHKFGREGHNIDIIDFDNDISSENSSLVRHNKIESDVISIKLGGSIYQAFHESIRIQRMYPTFGVWIINGLPSGIGIRLCSNEIANSYVCFFSHFFESNKHFNFRCTERQKNLRNSLYGDDLSNSKYVYGDFSEKINFSLIKKNEDYYKKFHAKSEITECHCGGGCASYVKASSDLNSKKNYSKGSHNHNSEGGRKFTKTNKNRAATGKSSSLFSSKS